MVACPRQLQNVINPWTGEIRLLALKPVPNLSHAEVMFRENLEQPGVKVAAGVKTIVAIEDDATGLFVGETLFVRSYRSQGVVDVGEGNDTIRDESGISSPFRPAG